MMRFLNFLFFIFIISSLIQYTHATCPLSYCTTRFYLGTIVKYPFKLQGQEPKICSNYTDLRCDPQNRTVVNLPFSGDFIAEDIDYADKTATLADPADCLLQRLMTNLNLSSSPFSAIMYENYTFYNCPLSIKLSQDGFSGMACLRNDTENATVASSPVNSPETMITRFGCSEMVTVEIPVWRNGQFDYSGFDSKLKLKWSAPDCLACHQTDKERSKFVGSKGFLALVIILGSLVLVSGLVCTIFYGRKRAPKTATTAVSPPPLCRHHRPPRLPMSIGRQSYGYHIFLKNKKCLESETY